MCREQLSLVQSRIYYIISYCRKKIGIFIKNISDSEFSERELCELADFIYFCLLILSTLSDGSTLSRETTHLKLMSTAVEEVRGSTNAVLMSNWAEHVLGGEVWFKREAFRPCGLSTLICRDTVQTEGRSSPQQPQCLIITILTQNQLVWITQLHKCIHNSLHSVPKCESFIQIMGAYTSESRV